MKPKALVVEDDDRIIDSIGDALFSIGHEHDWATNQHDAQQMLKAGDYSYVLMDLQIPAKPNRGGADKEFGVNLLEAVQQIKGRGRVPVIIMTAHSSDCLDLTTELFANGASDFIAKPFTSKGRTLTKVIRKVLEDHREQVFDASNGSTGECTRRQFSGGELVIFSERAELCGVKIISDMGAGQSLTLLRALSQQDRQRRFVRLSAEELVKAIGAKGGVGTVTGCVRGIRRNVVARLEKHLGQTAEPDDLIRNDSQGYYLRDWITIGTHGKPAPIPNGTGGTGSVTGGDATVATDVPDVAPGAIASDAVHGRFNPRQEWALTELRKGTKLRRAMLEQRFEIHARTAKRDLAELSHRGLIEFVGDGRDGYYVPLNTA